MRWIRAVPIALAVAVASGGAATAEDHEDHHGPIVVGEESETSATDDAEGLALGWSWDLANGDTFLVRGRAELFEGRTYVWVTSATCPPGWNGDDDCTEHHHTFESMSGDFVDVDVEAGTASITVTNLGCGDLDVDATLAAPYPDQPEPEAGFLPFPEVQGTRLSLVRRGGTLRFVDDGTSTGTICGLEQDLGPPTAQSVFAFEEIERRESTYVEARV